MATMLPANLPEDVASAKTSAAERILYRELASQLGPDYTVLYAVPWVLPERYRLQDGEADFVILHPRYGALVLEVKGGAIECDPRLGQWFSTDRTGTQYQIHNPFLQADRSLGVLKGKVELDALTRHLRVPWSRAVAFPDCLVQAEALGPAAPRELVIDGSGLSTLARSIRQAMTRPTVPGTAPGADGVAAIVRVLRPTVRLAALSLAMELQLGEERIVALTAGQTRTLQALNHFPQLAFRGVAGSGKTVLALEACRRFAKAGLRTLFTCFNRALAERTAQQLAADGAASIVVLNYHELAASWAKRAGLTVPQRQDEPPPANYFRYELPELLAQAAGILPDRFDAIVVDEGQDFETEWWVSLQGLLAESNSHFYIFYDERQRLYTGAIDLPIPHPHVELDENVRNTRAIHRQLAAYVPSGTDAGTCLGLKGRPIQHVPVQADGVVGALGRALHFLVRDEGLSLKNIVVLSARSAQHGSLANMTQAGAYPLNWGEPRDGAVSCRTIHSSKGLDWPVVVLVDLDRAHPDRRDALLYVGLSRGQQHIVVIGELPGRSG